MGHLVLYTLEASNKMPYSVKLPNVTLTSGQASSPAIVLDKIAQAATLQVGMSGAAGATYYEVSFDYNPNLPEASQTPTWLVAKASGADITGPLDGTAQSLAGPMISCPAFRVKSGTSALPTTFAATATFWMTASYPASGK